FRGPAVDQGSTEFEVLSADVIGVPTLVADDASIYLAAYTKTSSGTNIEIRKYSIANPQAGVVKADLASLLPGEYMSYAASPGLPIEPVVKDPLRLLIAGTLLSASTPNVNVLTLDASNGMFKKAATQPTPTNLGVVGYDSDPTKTAPKLFNLGGLGGI